MKSRKPVRSPRYKKSSASKPKVLPEAQKRIENNLGYNPFNGTPKSYFGAS